MYHTQNVRLPDFIRSKLSNLDNSKSTSKAIVDVMSSYAGNKDAALALIVRHLHRLRDTGAQEDTKVVRSTIYAPKALCESFGETAKHFGYSFDSLLTIAVKDTLAEA